MPARKKPEKPAPVPTPGKASTINDIARLSGVSKKTVSRIINTNAAAGTNGLTVGFAA